MICLTFSAPGGDLQTIIDDNLVPYERDVVKFVQDVVEALAYLHHRKIAHTDIKVIYLFYYLFLLYFLLLIYIYFKNLHIES